MNRRELLKMTGLVAMGGTLGMSVGVAQTAASGASHFFDVKTFGAVGDGKALAGRAINKAIETCHAAGGGVVYLSPGIYLSGTVVLKSNVTLYLEAGATLLGSKDLSHYSGSHLPIDPKHRHLIFARDAENLGVAGPGRIDGQGPSFWVPTERTVPPDQAWRDGATHYWKGLDRPTPLLEFYKCKNLRIEDVNIVNAPGWTLRPIQCEYVFIRGITIKNPIIGPNTDGIDLTCCQNVFISDCSIDTGDDAICLKSEPGYGTGTPLQKNITVTNCVLTTCCNAFKIGTGTHGGFENITFSNSLIVNPEADLKSRAIAGIALEMVDGGWLEGVTISNIRMQRVRTPIFIRRGNRTGEKAGGLRGFMINNVHATGAAVTSSITGIPGSDVEDVTLSNIRIDSEENGQADWAGREIPEVTNNYPEARMFGRLPSHGFYCRHVKGLRMTSIELTAPSGEARPAIICDDVKGFTLDGFRTTSISDGQPVIKLVQTQDAFLRGCSAPPGTKTFLAIEGKQSGQIALLGSNLTGAEQALSTGREVAKEAVTMTGNVGKA